MKSKKCCLSLTFLLFMALSHLAQAEIEFVCPCTYQSGSPTSAIIQAGVRNLGSETTGEIRIDMRGITDGNWSNLGVGYFPDPLGVGETYSNTHELEFEFTDRWLEDGHHEIYAYLVENTGDYWRTNQILRFEPEVYLDKSTGGGYPYFGVGLYLDGIATASFSDELDEITINLPPIINGSRDETTDTLTLRLGQYATDEFWGAGYISVGSYELDLALGPSEESPAQTITMPFTAREDYEYVHLSIRSEDGWPIYLWQNVSAPVPVQHRDFLVNSIDTLKDTDEDGVSDFNESLMEKNPADASSKPGTSVLDVMVLYTPNVADLYSGEPETRVTHVLEYANDALANSGVDARFRLVHLEEVQYSEEVGGRAALSAIWNEEGIFSGLDARAVAAGADLVVLFGKNDGNDNLCGVAGLFGFNTRGDFHRVAQSAKHSFTYINCGSYVAAHEFGHNLGLGHDRLEDSNKGTFPWSRGHGIEDEFVTIMAYRSGFSGAPKVGAFSTPNAQCEGETGDTYPCGVDRTDTEEGADAALSLDTVRFQAAKWSPDPPDYDGDGLINFEDSDDDNDGVSDDKDAFPLDATEQADTDGDGIGNNADTDDDNDGLSDALEISLGLNPLDADTDDDGLPDGWENASGLDPAVADYMVSAGYRFACALDDTGVVCWGNNEYEQTTVPSLTNPTQVNTGWFHACALDDTGVVCWGFPGNGQTTVPSLANPTQVSAGSHHSCALDDTGVVCWGRNEYEQTTVPSLTNPTQVTAGRDHTCAIDDTGVVCWGRNVYGQTTVPSLNNPSQLSVGAYHTCALDNTGAVCWGDNAWGQRIVPSLKNPAQLSAGYQNTCALDDAGVVCWGGNEDGQATIPNLLIDPDGDGYSTQGEADAFPLDASEWLDTDSDGIGNNADTDDDNDGYSDVLEISVGLDPLDANDVTGSPREIFWRNAENGQNVLWSMETQHLVARNVVNIVHDLSWKVIGLADFTGDGQDEVLFRHANGDNRVWTMVNGQRVSSDTITGAHSDWFVAALGDFDADGDADLFWRNQETGANRYWEMDGLIRLSSLAVRSVHLDWKVAGSGDFDGDGRNDLFWRDSKTGVNVIWLMESEEIATRSQIRTVDPVWEVSGIGDFDGDGMDDIFWQYPSTGNNSIWLLNGAELKSRHSLPKTSVGWRAFGVLDMNGDSFADILLRHNVYGSNRLWLMNGATRTHSLGVGGVPDLNWEPVAVGNTP